ncbi:MAG: hypothetical protein KF803_01495 [Cyclobacteriaceae bacterium]|nr:hypothetical protein [Cyclobacteriaceae bacterium]
MKITLLVCFLAFMAIESFGQQNQDKMFYAAKAEKYRRMRKTGTTLTVTGGILTVVGLVTLSNSSYEVYSSGGTTYKTSTGNPGLGVAAYLLGAGGLGAGIPLWIVGSKSERKYNQKLEGITAGIRLSPQQAGLTLRYRF